MACIDATVGELERDGWLVNQTRMWLASQWTVRHGADWRDGEDRFFTHLLDGSRAANRLGWQWTIGAGTGKPYGFSRWQVEKRAPELCAGCARRDDCPIEDWPAERTLTAGRRRPAARSRPRCRRHRRAGRRRHHRRRRRRLADRREPRRRRSCTRRAPGTAGGVRVRRAVARPDCGSRRSGSCSSPNASPNWPSRARSRCISAIRPWCSPVERSPPRSRRCRRRAGSARSSTWSSCIRGRGCADPRRLDQQLLGMAPGPLTRHTAHDGSTLRGDLAAR